CEYALIPITARQPSQKIEEIGARLWVPSALLVPMSTTGVPKYKMEGLLIFFMTQISAAHGTPETRLLRKICMFVSQTQLWVLSSSLSRSPRPRLASKSDTIFFT